MLDLPELDDKVCLYLNWNDLARCARVSKKWHSIVIPHLWRDLSWPWSDISRIHKKGLCDMALADYLSNQQHRALLGQGNNNTEQSLSPPHFSTTLSKYGHLIRVLPGPMDFLDSFQATYPPGQGKNPDAQEVFLHLIRHCSFDVRVPIIRLSIKYLNPAPAMKTILDFSLPRVVHMCVFVVVHADGQGISRVMDLLERCSIALEKLELGIVISNARMKCAKENQLEDEPKVWISLKELILTRCDDSSDAKAFWPWLLKKCIRAEKLTIRHRTELVEILVQGMLAHMPNLTEIDLAHWSTRNPDDRMGHSEIVTFFTGSRKGWRAVKLGQRVVFEKEVMDALALHFPTLKVLDLSGCDDLSGNEVVQILRSCTTLHTFLNTQISFNRRRGRFKIDAKAFIDSDSDKGSLRPWDCEKTLKKLKINIVGIPRPDLEGSGVIEETWPGEGREIQGRVYDRLARLTNLEILWLGDDLNGKEPGCLEMSPESGLVKLSGLKKLSEIGVPGTIEVGGVRWMAENWPRLRTIRGLCQLGTGYEATRSLRQIFPDIVVYKWRWQN
ncbi:MAG: hypothetical protein J3Q66DRAFT_351106 [Benniella sp.]|nr:MAG: hypothetical protein J3Q66DRAFT_351106 [Benniella sp.]